jgi:large subunit ribosomal protein L5
MLKVREKYETQVKEKLAKDFSIENKMAVPKIEKVVLNVGFGRYSSDERVRNQVINDMSQVTGQKPSIRNAKKAISAFKIRQGQPIGAQVTLRGKKMYDFLDKLVSIVLPRVRDFRGVSETSFDGHGNYTLGFREFSVFPEIEYTKTDKQSGIELTIVTNAKEDSKGKALLEGIGIPFRKVKN